MFSITLYFSSIGVNDTNANTDLNIFWNIITFEWIRGIKDISGKNYTYHPDSTPRVIEDISLTTSSNIITSKNAIEFNI